MDSYAFNVLPSISLAYITLFGTCALISGAGRTINDLWDRNLESAVGTLSDTYVPPSRRPHACRLTDVPTTQSASNVFPGPRRINTTGHHVYHAPIDGGAHRASTVVYIRPHSLTYCKNGTFYRLLTGSQLRKSSSLVIQFWTNDWLRFELCTHT